MLIMVFRSFLHVGFDKVSEIGLHVVLLLHVIDYFRVFQPGDIQNVPFNTVRSVLPNSFGYQYSTLLLPFLISARRAGFAQTPTVGVSDVLPSEY